MRRFSSTKPSEIFGAAYKLRFCVNMLHLQDKAARINGINERLLAFIEERMSAAQANLITIADKTAIFGYFHALSSLFDSNMTAISDLFANHLLEVCSKASNLVAPIVHNMSPEGYVPQEFLLSLGIIFLSCLHFLKVKKFRIA